MANERDKGRPGRAMAEQPTQAVDVAGVPSPAVDALEDAFDGDGPTVTAVADAIGLPSGETTLSLADAPMVYDPPGVALDDTQGVDAESWALGGDETSGTETAAPEPAAVPARLEPTSSLPWPGMPIGPALKEVIARQYRVDALLSEGDGYRIHLGSDSDGAPVVLRTYMNFEEVRQRPMWRSLLEAYEGGRPLPALLTAPGVIPLLDLREDARYGPVVVTAWLGGATLGNVARQLSVGALVRCFCAVAGVLARAHAEGVAYGAFTADDIVMNDARMPHLDLSVAAFSDALDIGATARPGPPEGDGPSPEGDVWWLGRAMKAALPADVLQPGADLLAAVAQSCLDDDPRPTAAEVHQRLSRTPARRRRNAAPRSATVALLVFSVVAALGAGWLIGGGLNRAAEESASPPVAAPMAESGVDDRLAEAEAAVASGAWLRAGQIYRLVAEETGDPRAQAGWQRLRAERSFRRSLKDLKTRLAGATQVTPAVRRDVEMLRVLQPDSLVLKHWLGRLADNQEAVP